MSTKDIMMAAAGASTPAVYVEDVFSTYLYTGAGGTSTITNDIDLSGKGGMVWIKGRSAASDNVLTDTTRGAGTSASNNQALSSNLTTAEDLGASYDYISAFNSNGFDVTAGGTTTATKGMNNGSTLYSSWTFRKQAKFFDVVTYTGDGTSSRSISHNLGSTPGMVVVKNVTSATNWTVWHTSLGSASTVCLNLTDAAGTNSGTGGVRRFGYVSDATSASFTVTAANGDNNVNKNGDSYIAYLFAHNSGGFGASGTDNVISCGSFTTDGTGLATIDLGYEPQFVLLKASSTAGDWILLDDMRGMTATTADWRLQANNSNAEASSTAIDPTSTGFKSNGLSTSTTYIYIAVRHGPMKTPTDATKVFTPTVYTGTNADNRLISTTTLADMVWIRLRASTTIAGMYTGFRLTGQEYALTGSVSGTGTDADSFDAQIVSAVEYGTAFSSMNGVWVGNDPTRQFNASTTSNGQIIETFTRAPGFFDIVTYTGTGATPQNVTHGLGVVPELIIVKARNDAGLLGWAVYSTTVGADKYMLVNSNATSVSDTTFWNNTAPTASVFSVGSSTTTNKANVNFIAMLFATCPKVSKVGLYTGNGSSQTVNCDFTAGSRLVLIKRIDVAGDWLLADSARGIVAGNDPLLELNTTAAEVTTIDWIDTDNSGFVINQEATNNANVGITIDWISQTSTFVSSNVNGAVYGNGLYIIVGDSGKLATSTDGVTWTSRTSGFGTNVINGVTYGNGLFVAVGNNGTMTTSTDGITWTSRTSGFGTTHINGVTYGNGLFVAVGDNGTMTTSTDGITWTSRTSGFGTTNIYGVTYGNGLFVAAGQNGVITTSTDGITWTSRTSGVGTTLLRGVGYGNGLFVAVGQNGVITTSTDGITWTSRTSGVTDNLRTAAYGDGFYVAVGQNGRVLASTDGITWTSRTTPIGGTQLNFITFGDGRFVAPGSSGTLITSTGGKYLFLAIA